MKSKLYFSFLGLTLLSAILLFFARTFEGNFLLELIISFLPLMTLGLAILFIIAMILTAIFFKKVNTRHQLITSIIVGWVLLLSLSSLILSTIQVTSVLDNTVLAHERDLEKSTQAELRVAFFNKFFFNYNFDPLVTEVKDNFIDILAMAELSESSYQELKVKLGLPYSYYTNCYCRSMLGDPVAVFSRYPLSNIKTDGLNEGGIIEANITINDATNIQLVTLHPDAPMTPELLNRRNNVLQSLDVLIQPYRDKKVILLGDFNTSSWSPTFTRFLQQNPFLKDTARGFGLQTTWGPYFVRTKIDHVLVSQDIAVKDFSVKKIEGSDHDMVIVKLGL